MFGRARKRRGNHIALELLSAYLDGQVTPQECAWVERHLRHCEACAYELETLRYTTRLLSAVPQVKVPHAFTLSEADVRRSMVHLRVRRLSLYLQGATALVAALLLVVVVGDILLTPPRLGPPQPWVIEKAVVETVVVEKRAKPREMEGTPEVQEREVEKVVVATPPARPAVGAEITRVVEKPEEVEMRALAITPTGTGRAPEVRLESGIRAPAAKPTVAPLRAKEVVEEAPKPPPPARPSAVPSPEAVPQEAATLLAEAPAPIPSPSPLPPPGAAVKSTARWSSLRVTEIVLSSLLVILGALSLWARRQR